MVKKLMNEKIINKYIKYLIEDEKTENTIKKYKRDLIKFMNYSGKEEVKKELVISYKYYLINENYSERSINSMLSVLNSFFLYFGWFDCQVKLIKIQEQIYIDEEKNLTKDDFKKLCSVAERRENERLCLIMQTICCAGLRISELRFITVEALKQNYAVVSLKGKTRKVFIIGKLKIKLENYVQKNNIESGPIFVSRSGKPLNRSNIWKEMKTLCKQAGVNPNKVFPHNLRHLFAKEFYEVNNDIAKLADILGHSNINTTRVYIKSLGNDHLNEMEMMNLLG